MKVSIIGGGGLVGSMAAYALQCGGIVNHLCLIDANADAAKGHALELLHGAALTSDQRLSAGTMEDVATSNIVVITAGLRRKPDESRLDLINRNVDLFLALLDQVKAAGLKDRRLPRRRQQPGGRADVPGGAAQRPAVAARPRPGHAAGHGPFPRLSRQAPRSAGHAGAGDDPRRARRQHGADLVQRHRRRPAAGAMAGLHAGCAERGVRGHEDGRSAAHQAQGRLRLRASACRSAKSSNRWPATAGACCRSARLQQGLYGIRDVCLSVPTVVGCGGVRQQIELPLTPKERLAMQQSARVLRETIDQVEARIGKVRANHAATPAPRGNAIPRSAWQRT